MSDSFQNGISNSVLNFYPVYQNSKTASFVSMTTIFKASEASDQFKDKTEKVFVLQHCRGDYIK